MPLALAIPPQPTNSSGTGEFSKFGIPEKIFSGGGPKSISHELKELCHQNGIDLVLLSPYNPKSNGIFENSVKDLKKVVHCLFKPGRKINQKEWCHALLIHVNTPKRPSGLMPSQLMFGRVLCDGINLLKDLLSPEHKAAIAGRVQAIKDHQLSLAKADQLPPLAVGQCVAVQDPVTKKWSKFKTGILAQP